MFTPEEMERFNTLFRDTYSGSITVGICNIDTMPTKSILIVYMKSCFFQKVTQAVFEV